MFMPIEIQCTRNYFSIICLLLVISRGNFWRTQLGLVDVGARVAMVKRPGRYDKASEEVNKKVKKVQSDGATPATSSLSNWVGLSANDVRQ